LLVLALAGAAAGCDRNAGEKTAAAPAVVTVSQPLQRKVTDYAYFTGAIKAIPVVEIRARVSGYLVHVFFKDGQEVRKDEKLFEIDRRPFEAQVEQAKAQLERAKAAAATAKAEVLRNRDLVSTRAISQRDFEVSAGRAGETAAAVNGAQAALKSANINLGFTIIASPIAGRISSTNVDAGNLVLADKTSLTTVVAVDPMYVEFNADERIVEEVQERVRQKKVEKFAAAKVHVWVGLAADRGTYPHQGTVDFIDNRLDPGTRTVRVRAVLANPPVGGGPRRFNQGFSVHVKVPVSSAHQALLVSERALGTEQGQKYVLVVGADNKVLRRDVRVGTLRGGLRAIEQGLRPGEWVIVDGLQRVRPGVTVAPARQPMPPGPAAEAARAAEVRTSAGKQPKR
jgi:RND family efflux transporter MFP subunit